MWWSCSPSGKLHISWRKTMSQNGARSHGPNALLSMVDNNLNNYFKKQALAMHANNCVGQNRNWSVTAYTAWRVIVGFTDDVSLSFMTVGQTLALFEIGRLPSSSSQLKASLDTVASLLGRIPALLSSSIAMTERPTPFSSWNQSSTHWTSSTMGGTSA